MDRIRVSIGVALLLITLTCVSSAQDQNLTHKAPAISLDVDLVLVTATVTESAQHRPVRGLERKDFQVWEDKVEQKISYFSSEDVPVSVGIIFDVSGSMKDKLGNAQRAAATFFKSGTPDDEYFEIQFADRPHIASDFTTDVTRLQNGLLSIPAKGSTALYDAVYLGLHKLKDSTNPKKALLLITDGEDNRSRYSFANVRDFIREQDVELYAIGIIDPSSGGREALINLADLTGGKAFFPSLPSDMSDICKKISVELKNQYVIGYRSTNTSKDGAWRKIKVKVASPQNKALASLDVRNKIGYYAPSGDDVVAGKK